MMIRADIFDITASFTPSTMTWPLMRYVLLFFDARLRDARYDDSYHYCYAALIAVTPATPLRLMLILRHAIAAIRR